MQYWKTGRRERNISSEKTTQLASGPADVNVCHTAESGADDVTDVHGKIPR